jgi:hypothetical protein
MLLMINENTGMKSLQYDGNTDIVIAALSFAIRNM